jgi:heparanase 1
VVVRQTLSGADYGLMDDVTLTPRSDYWVSVLWKRLMGTVVLAAASDDPLLLAYAHCTAAPADAPSGAVTVVLLNLDRAEPRTLVLNGLSGPLHLYLLTADDLLSPTVRLNGRELQAALDGTPPPLDAEVLVRAPGEAWVTLPPLTLAFVVAPNASVGACESDR